MIEKAIEISRKLDDIGYYKDADKVFFRAAQEELPYEEMVRPQSALEAEEKIENLGESRYHELFKAQGKDFDLNEPLDAKEYHLWLYPDGFISEVANHKVSAHYVFRNHYDEAQGHEGYLPWINEYYTYVAKHARMIRIYHAGKYVGIIGHGVPTPEQKQALLRVNDKIGRISWDWHWENRRFSGHGIDNLFFLIKNFESNMAEDVRRRLQVMRYFLDQSS